MNARFFSLFGGTFIYEGYIIQLFGREWMRRHRPLLEGQTITKSPPFLGEVTFIYSSALWAILTEEEKTELSDFVTMKEFAPITFWI